MMTPPNIEDIVADLAAELAAVRAELAELKASQRPADVSRPLRISEAEPLPRPDHEVTTTSRRRLLALAGGAAAAAVAATAATSATPAAAADGSNMVLASGAPVNPNATSTATPPATIVNYASATSNTVGYFVVTDGGAPGAPADPNQVASIAGLAVKNGKTGVFGRSDVVDGNGVMGVATTTAGGSGYGVWGQTVSGIGVVGQSTAVTGYDFKAAGQGRILVNNHTLIGPPTSGNYLLGELIRDTAGDWYVCYATGTPGSWRKLGGGTTAGALHVINPTRVYDSRLPGAGGSITSGANRVVNVSNGIDLTTGAVTAPNVVPTGATAIAYNLTIAGATSGGFLAVAPGSATVLGASTINWTAGTPFLANGTLVKLDNQRQIKVFAGGGGTTDFIVDILGYYL